MVKRRILINPSNKEKMLCPEHGGIKSIETEEDYNNLVKLYVDWDKKTYGKNHRRISPPSAYFSWWKLCYKNDVDKHFAKRFEPRNTKKQIGIEKENSRFFEFSAISENKIWCDVVYLP